MRLTYRLVPEWPPLAWIARQSRGEKEILVWHGPRLETHQRWFGEIVWAGDLARGDFDKTDIVFGSGAVAGENELIYVSSASTVDRLQWIEAGGFTWVSNSLACLLAHVGGSLDATDRSWFDRLGTIRRGIDDYERELPTSAGVVRLAYFHNLSWNGSELRERAKPHSVDGFGSFEDYRRYLARALKAIGANATDPRRVFRLEPLGTLSGGMDSPMVAAVAREAMGLAEAITFAREDGTDTGEEVADALGIALTVFSRQDWRSAGEAPEAPFIAGDAKGEDVFLGGAEALLAGRVLLTGHNAGILLDRNRADTNTVLRRKDRSGTSLTEWRLHAGFIHCPIGYLGARHAPDLTRISRLPEMDPWSQGSWYDKPIARRIVEEAGVPRSAFGTVKRASSILFFKPGGGMSPGSTRDLRAWLRDRSIDFLRQGRIPPGHGRALLVVARWLSHAAGAALLGLRKRLPAGRGGRLERLATRMNDHGERDALFDYAFPWAVERMKRRYPQPAGAALAAHSEARFAGAAGLDALEQVPLEPVQT